jgi:hypothetical protein
MKTPAPTRLPAVASAATPRPWKGGHADDSGIAEGKFQGTAITSEGRDFKVVCDGGYHYGFTIGIRNLADAELIVTAVNAYDRNQATIAALAKSLEAGASLIARSLTRVSHGAPTKEEAQAWLESAKAQGDTRMSVNCRLCGEPMPKGEEMFYYHGYSGSCPKPPLPKEPPVDWKARADAQAATIAALREGLGEILHQAKHEGPDEGRVNDFIIRTAESVLKASDRP